MNQQTTREEIRKQQVSRILEQLTEDYKQTKNERATLGQKLNNSENDVEEFTVLEELEILTSDIRGFGCQIADTGKVQNMETAISHLRKLTVFDVPTIRQFYFDDSDQFKRIKRYIHDLDYLRLLVLEYLQTLSLEASVAA